MSSDLPGGGRSRARRPVRLVGAALLAGVALLTACGPALDWRQFQPEGWPLSLALPCKPNDQQRRLSLAGQPVLLRMLTCSTDDHVFAVASADMGDPAHVAPALQALAAAARANVRGVVVAERAAAVPGMTPQAGARHWQLRGQLPDGRAVAEQVQVFAHGTRVFQASVVGPAADDARAAPLFDALRLQP